MQTKVIFWKTNDLSAVQIPFVKDEKKNSRKRAFKFLLLEVLLCSMRNSLCSCQLVVTFWVYSYTFLEFSFSQFVSYVTRYFLDEWQLIQTDGLQHRLFQIKKLWYPIKVGHLPHYRYGVVIHCCLIWLIVYSFIIVRTVSRLLILYILFVDDSRYG